MGTSCVGCKEGGLSIDWDGGGACVALLAFGGLVLRWVVSSSSNRISAILDAQSPCCLFLNGTKIPILKNLKLWIQSKNGQESVISLW